MESNLSVLIVDDEVKISEAVAAYLKSKNFTVFTAETGRAALDLFASQRIDFVILDLMLPDLAGEEVCARIRKVSSVPVIMLTAKVQEEDVLNGLHTGADDYVTKPFSIKQLYARMEAVLRRTKPERGAVAFDDGDLRVDFKAMEVTKGGESVFLTASEWKILSALIGQPRSVFSREQLIEAAFADDFDGYDRVIDTHIKNLRKKIETDTRHPRYILTVRGSGYKFGGQS